MKELTCPYLWDCGQKFEAHEMSEYDYNFLKSATEKKMTFMFIHCPKCSRRFEFDTVEWVSTGIISDPTKKIQAEKKKREDLVEVLKKVQVEIPQIYYDYLIGEKFKPEISIIRGQDKFHLYTLEELCEPINIDGNSSLRISGLKSYTKSLEETFGKENTEGFTLFELSECLTIGYENEAILFLDSRDNNSLWIFYPDGGDIQATKKTIEKIVKRK